MLYEVRTYNVLPGKIIEFEKNDAKIMSTREKYSKLGAWWHTEIGPLNQMVHVWPYESLKQCEIIRKEALAEPGWPPSNNIGFIINMNTEIWDAAPFMQRLEQPKSKHNIYEMCIDTYQPDSIEKVIQCWSELIAERKRLSTLTAAMSCQIGNLDRWIHIWSYEGYDERDSVRKETSKLKQWPPATNKLLVDRQSKILLPASFSPLQ